MFPTETSNQIIKKKKKYVWGENYVLASERMYGEKTKKENAEYYVNIIFKHQDFIHPNLL